MRLCSLTRCWWRPKPGVARLLIPLAVLYGLLVRLRRAAYQRGLLVSARVPAPVVAVGNLVVGGSGKTPVTLALVEALLQAGFRPGVVSRGHPVAPARPRFVTPASRAEEVGDEPLLHAARGVPVVVCRDRLAAARALCAQHPNVDVIVADDALQHYRLGRDIEIELVSAEHGYGNGRLLPVGPLREPLARAAACDFRLVVGAHGIGAPCDAEGQGRFVERVLEAPRHLQTGETASWCAFHGERALIVAGIAHPERFAQALAAQGVTGRLVAFPDHHAFRREDLAALEDAPILVTEKDAVKLACLADRRLWVVPMRVRLPPAFVDTLIGRLRLLRHPQASSPHTRHEHRSEAS